MAWWIGVMGVYVVGFLLAKEALGGQLTKASAGIAFIGLLIANFIGIGMSARQRGESRWEGLKIGAKIGGFWLLVIVGLPIVLAAALIFLGVFGR